MAFIRGQCLFESGVYLKNESDKEVSYFNSKVHFQSVTKFNNNEQKCHFYCHHLSFIHFSIGVIRPTTG